MWGTWDFYGLSTVHSMGYWLSGTLMLYTTQTNSGRCYGLILDLCIYINLITNVRADNECRTSRHGDENCHFSGIYESRLRRDVAYNTHTLSLSRYYEWIHVGIQFVSSQRDKWLVLPEGRVAHE